MTALSTRALVAFSSPAFALAALGLPIVVALPPLYAELGLGLTAVGTIFMAARFFDVVTDPAFGVLGDRFNTRWGRRGPAMVLACRCWRSASISRSCRATRCRRRAC